MRNKLLVLGMILTAIMLAALPLMAQDEPDAPDADDDDEMVWVGRMGRGGGEGPMFKFVEEMKLTKEQEKKLQEMRVAHQKEMIPLRAQLKVKQIEMRELFRGDPNQGAINSKIDEIGKMRADIQKKSAAHRIAMRNVLTPEQRELWDSRPHRMGKGFDGPRGRGMKMHRGMRGECPQGMGGQCAGHGAGHGMMGQGSCL